MSRSLGINQIGSIERPSILAGDFPRVTAEITAGEDLVLGSLLYKDDAVVKQWDGDEEHDVYGVAAEAVATGNVGVAWLTGEFIGPRLTVADPEEADWEAAIDSARKVSIFLKEARLAPNQ